MVCPVSTDVTGQSYEHRTTRNYRSHEYRSGTIDQVEQPTRTGQRGPGGEPATQTSISCHGERVTLSPEQVHTNPNETGIAVRRSPHDFNAVRSGDTPGPPFDDGVHCRDPNPQSGGKSHHVAGEHG
jgi:hypothetical protein